MSNLIQRRTSKVEAVAIRFAFVSAEDGTIIIGILSKIDVFILDQFVAGYDTGWDMAPYIKAIDFQQFFYFISLAEAAAWDFVNENKIEMVVINTTMVAGHLLQPEVKESVQPIQDIINASGRYCLLERMVHCLQLAKILHDLYQTLQILDNCEDDEPYMPLYQFSKEKINSLGIEFIPLEDK
ncbi:cinnamoyl-CoA reductase CAD2-like [Vicia villosa]|uniref:cinnamoyl-CoA reductase CAD2-like n=1 Tax=Vicia villosa TaxID=3911 RepID=UPI00273B81EC|nr:cinnamoyl-CoA reductase CAD2-like [Vicia villosa]